MVRRVGTQTLVMERLTTGAGMEEEFKCIPCENMDKVLRYLKLHMKGMQGARRYTCDLCENVVMSSKEWEQHMLISHGSMSTRPNLSTAGGWGRGVTFKVMEV